MAALLLDTYSLFYRSFYALPPMSTKEGQPTGALYGFSALLLKLLREHRPSGAAFALDLPGGSFRQRLYPAYKAGRQETPPALRTQLDMLPSLLDAFGFPRFAAEGFEADDVLATLSRELTESGQRVLIASGDRDLLQLVDELTQVLFLGRRGKPPERYDPVAVLTRFGVPPTRLPAYVALAGDSADNLPKLAGMGPANIQKLIAVYPDIATLLAHLQDVPSPRVRQTLARHRDQLVQNEALARLQRHVPLEHGTRAAPFDAQARERTRALFETLEFRSLLPRLAALT